MRAGDSGFLGGLPAGLPVGTRRALLAAFWHWVPQKRRGREVLKVKPVSQAGHLARLVDTEDIAVPLLPMVRLVAGRWISGDGV
jgi:hypothetical protein